MKQDRRQFLKQVGITSAMISTGATSALGEINGATVFENMNFAQENTTLIGSYGPWASSLIDKMPSLSFRNDRFNSIDSWKKEARQRLLQRLGMPDTGATPRTTVNKRYEYDGLHIEELTWQLSYGPPTAAVLLKPANAKGKLPGILAFHDHAGNKYFGTRKIIRTGDSHPMMKEHQQHYYDGRAWANELARRGFVVLVSDAFPFASRRVLLQDVPNHLREGLTDEDPENPENIRAYNAWAARHEHIMAKSLFSAGTTWPGVFLAEDRVALDVLSSRSDVDAGKIGCAGLSGGGMRTAFLGGLDDRIKCAVCVGFMTTWKDFALNKSFTHTWMTYVPILPNELDFPEILGMRAPLPTLVLNDAQDQLFTMPEMERANTILRSVFDKAGASDKYACSFYPGRHKFDAPMQEEAFRWFDKWLK